MDPFTAVCCCCVVVSDDAKADELALCKLYLLRGGPTLCHGVLEHGLNLHRNILLNQQEVGHFELSVHFRGFTFVL